MNIFHELPELTSKPSNYSDDSNNSINNIHELGRSTQSMGNRSGSMNAMIENIDMDIGIVREFSFTSSLQRMSVITRKLMDQHFNVYSKGSPEMILTLCKPVSVVKIVTVSNF